MSKQYVSMSMNPDEVREYQLRRLTELGMSKSMIRRWLAKIDRLNEEDRNGLGGTAGIDVES
jgi:hypothetical protein